MGDKIIPPASVSDILGTGVSVLATSPTGYNLALKGAMIYDHKTAGSIQIMSPESFRRFKKETDYKGYKSCLNFDKEEDIIRDSH